VRSDPKGTVADDFNDAEYAGSQIYNGTRIADQQRCLIARCRAYNVISYYYIYRILLNSILIGDHYHIASFHFLLFHFGFF